MVIDAARQTFDMMEITNRRFMYNTDTCALILGDQAALRGDSFGSHAEDHGNSGLYEPFDSFIRGWIGTGEPYTQSVIHFAPPINGKNPDNYVDGYNTLQMFRENGAGADTVVRGFPGAWEQPLSNILSGFMEESKEKESEGLRMKMNATAEIFEPVELLGKPALFTNTRLDRATVPPSLFAYDIRHGDDGNAATVEKSVAANHMGTVILAEPLYFGIDDYITLTEDNSGLNFAAEHECTTIAGYRAYLKSINPEPQYYGVWAMRSAASVLGAAEAWSKDDGIPMVFTSFEAAEQRAARQNQRIGSANVHYRVREMGTEAARSALAALTERDKLEEARDTVYPYTAAYAREHGELAIYRQSSRLNSECAKAIDAAISANWNGANLAPEGARAVLKEYGTQRVNMVLANTVSQMDYDTRFSADNRTWAKGFHALGESGVTLSSHPVKLDQFINQAVRGVLERDAGERPSALGKLEAAKRDVKPPAPKTPGKTKDKEME